MEEKEAQNTISYEEIEQNEKIVIKYKLLREKIIKHYHNGCRILDITKIVVAVFFLLFTAVAVLISGHTGNELFWLIIWVILIFLNVGIFLITDYCKYLVKDKVIPYLEDDNQLEFGEYDIFKDDDDDDEEGEDD